jgi:Protein of unknown function (DUF1207)
MLRLCGHPCVLLCALALLAACLACANSFADDVLESAEGTIVFLQPLGEEIANREEGGETTEELPPDNLGEFDSYDGYMSQSYYWQVAPSGLIYHSYLAGPHEPRTSITPFFSGNQTLWDASVGGRGGVLRYGTSDPLYPQGWQLDVYGAAIVRLDAENNQDLDSTDYVFGFPITYGDARVQYKFGYAHLSSHLGDELAISDPQTLDNRVNYVRDSLVVGTSRFPYPAWRIYGEMGWAFNASGGAEPFEFQFGQEISAPGPTGVHGTPFVAVNGRMREEHNYGGDLTAQMGWLWRGDAGSTFRLGAHYYNGKSSQFQFYDQTEQQIGMGLWYDF